MREKVPCVYIMTNKKYGTLYTGVTSDLVNRVNQHKNNLVDGFTKKYQTHTLVYYEVGESIISAIEREKQIKGGSRKKKFIMIESLNPDWKDLYEEII
ncbi:MAG: GIY-YIG nuclease family protein [Minisyncoccia bacterium]